MPGLDPGIHDLGQCRAKGVDGRNKSGHDGMTMLNRNHFIWTVAFVIITAALMWPAFWNGYPILFADTGGYLARPFEGTLAFGRSALYGAFLAAGMKLDFWPNVITQAALCAFVLIVVMRAHGVGRPLTITLVAVALAVLTGLPFYATQLVPDVFVALAVLSLYLLAFRDAAIGPTTRYGLVAAIAFAVASHMTILVLALVMLATFAILRMLPHPLPRPVLAWPASALVAGIVVALVSNFAIAGQLRFTPGGTSFLFGRLIQDGIVPRYLAEHCPDQTIRLCAYRGEMANTADGWLWGNDTPFWKLGGPEGNANEERRIILETLRLYPLQHLRTALGATYEQFFMARTMTSLSAYDNHHVMATLSQLAPELLPRLAAARQQREGALDLSPFNVVHLPVGFIAVALLPVIIVLGAWRRLPREAAAFALTVLLALVANAAISGIFSNPVDRYQSRLLWLAPLSLVITALSCRDLGTRRELA